MWVLFILLPNSAARHCYTGWWELPEKGNLISWAGYGARWPVLPIYPSLLYVNRKKSICPFSRWKTSRESGNYDLTCKRRALIRSGGWVAAGRSSFFEHLEVSRGRESSPPPSNRSSARMKVILFSRKNASDQSSRLIIRLWLPETGTWPKRHWKLPVSMILRTN